jgi:hypothetical protein
MHRRFPELVDALRRRFEFNGLKPGLHTVILANTNSYRPVVEAAQIAAASLGANPVLVTIPWVPPYSQDIPYSAERAIVEAEYFIDLQPLSWFYTVSNNRVRAALSKKGAMRTSAMGLEEDVDTIIANVPDLARRERAEHVMALIDRGRIIRVTTREGTDYTVERGVPAENPMSPDNKYGQAAFSPLAGSARGVIAAVGGVRIASPIPERFHVRAPLRLEMEDGRVVRVDRGTAEGCYLDDWFNSFDHEDARDFSHVNLGLVALSIRNLDNEAIHFAYGGVLSAFGVRMSGWEPRPYVPNHVDFWMARASYYVDDMPILQDGAFTAESGLQSVAG